MSMNNHWYDLYKLGGIASHVIAILLVGEIFVYALIPDRSTPGEIFALFQDSTLAGLLFFDLLGMISYLLYIPLVLSFYMVLRQSSESIMVVATFLFFVGITVFFATNTGFALLSLSRQYEIAKTQEEREILLAACQTMITLFDVHAFMVSYVIVSAAWTMMAFVMLRSSLFSRITAYAGILAGLSGILAEILENISEAFVMIAISFYFAAIVFLIIWVVLSGRRLYQLGINPGYADS
jgi:hypothetical protein